MIDLGAELAGYSGDEGGKGDGSRGYTIDGIQSLRWGDPHREPRNIGRTADMQKQGFCMMGDPQQRVDVLLDQIGVDLVDDFKTGGEIYRLFFPDDPDS